MQFPSWKNGQGGKMQIGVKTYADPNTGRIIQEVFNYENVIMKQVMETKEEQIRQALIALGWTPPK
jgi:hypothetical protein